MLWLVSRTSAQVIHSVTRRPHRIGEHELPRTGDWVAIEPKSQADMDKLGTALNKLSEEDPTFQVSTDEESGQTVILAWANCTSKC